MNVKIGILTVSDRAAAGKYEDISGNTIFDTLNVYLTSSWEAIRKIVPDEKDLIAAAFTQMADEEGCCLIFSTGGTGPAKRDVTPEATKAVCEKILPGVGELMRAKSLEETPMAALSRQIAGIRGKTLIVNLPGNPKGVHKCLEAVFPVIPHCLQLLEWPLLETNPNVITVAQPHH